MSTSASSSVEPRRIMPKPHQSIDELVLARSLADNMNHSFSLHISTPTPGTSALLEYYNTSYWDNSLANNPEGVWLSIASSNPAMFHSTLCVVALQKTQIYGDAHAKSSYLWQPARHSNTTDFGQSDQYGKCNF